MVVTMNRKLIVTHTSPPDRRGRRNHMRMELDLDAPVDSPKQWMDVTQVMTKAEVRHRCMEAREMNYTFFHPAFLRNVISGRIVALLVDHESSAYRKIMDGAVTSRYTLGQAYGRATRPTGMVPEIVASFETCARHPNGCIAAI